MGAISGNTARSQQALCDNAVKVIVFPQADIPEIPYMITGIKKSLTQEVRKSLPKPTWRDLNCILSFWNRRGVLEKVNPAN